MYETDHHNDQGSPEALGSGPGAPRRPRASKPEYMTLLENRHARRLIAGQLGIRADQLRACGDVSTAEQEASDATAELLDDLIDALRAV